MTRHNFYSTVLWLWNSRYDPSNPGWGGHNLKTKPGPWTNFSLSTLLLDVWELNFKFVNLNDLLDYIEAIISYATRRSIEKKSKGFPPNYEMDWSKDYSTITTFAYLDCVTQFLFLKNKYYGAYENKDIENVMIRITDNMNEKFSDGYSFMPEYRSSSTSLVSTFVSGYIMKRIIDRINFLDIDKRIKTSLDEIDSKYNTIFTKFVLDTVKSKSKSKDKDYLLLPLKLDSDDESLAASSWFIIYLLNLDKEIADFNDDIEKITLGITKSVINIESDLGENNEYYPWFVPAIVLHALVKSPFSKLSDIEKFYNNLLTNHYFADSNNSYFYFERDRVRLNTWPTRDSLMALQNLYTNLEIIKRNFAVNNTFIENIYFENRIFLGGSFEDTSRYDVYSDAIEKEGFECVSALKISPIDAGEIAKWDRHLTDLCYLGIFDFTHHTGGGGLLEFSRMINNNKPIIIFIERKKYQTYETAIKDKLSSMIHTDPGFKRSICIYASHGELKEKLGMVLSEIRKKKPSELDQNIIIDILSKLR